MLEKTAAKKTITDKSMFDKIMQHKKAYYAVLITALTAIACTLMFHDNVWNDEVFTIAAVDNTWAAMQTVLINDVHPPLYYYIVKVFVLLFGFSIPVFKIASILPMVLIMVLGATIVDAYFGKESVFVPTGFILAVFCAPHMLTMAVEVRMYSWSAFFITASACLAYGIYRNGFTWGRIALFILVSLGAAYCHYFALVAVAVVYLYLFLAMFLQEKQNWKTCVIISIITIVGYLPWLMVFIQQLALVSSDYWIAPFTVKSVVLLCFSFLPGRLLFSALLLVALALGGMVLLAFYLLRYYPEAKRKTKEFKETITTGALFSSVFYMTIAIGVTISVLMRPIFTGRYAQPCLPIFWLGILLILEQLITKKQIKIAFLVLLLLYGGVEYLAEYKDTAVDLGAEKATYMQSTGIVSWEEEVVEVLLTQEVEE